MSTGFSLTQASRLLNLTPPRACRHASFVCVSAYTLKRFLVARKYDVENASQMLMSYIGWRVERFPENQIQSEEIQTSLAANKVQVLKYPDKKGHICIVVSN